MFSEYEVEEDRLGMCLQPGTVTLQKDSQNLIGISIGGGGPLCPCLYIVQVSQKFLLHLEISKIEYLRNIGNILIFVAIGNTWCKMTTDSKFSSPSKVLFSLFLLLVIFLKISNAIKMIKILIVSVIKIKIKCMDADGRNLSFSEVV